MGRRRPPSSPARRRYRRRGAARPRRRPRAGSRARRRPCRSWPRGSRSPSVPSQALSPPRPRRHRCRALPEPRQRPSESRSRVIRPPRKNSGSSLPRARFASVTVTSSPPACSRSGPNGPGAPRAHAEQSSGVDPGDRPSAGSDGAQVDGRQRDREAELELVVRDVVDGAAAHHADVRASSSHVERDQIAFDSQLAVVPACHDAAGQARQDHLR